MNGKREGGVTYRLTLDVTFYGPPPAGGRSLNSIATEINDELDLDGHVSVDRAWTMMLPADPS